MRAGTGTSSPALRGEPPARLAVREMARELALVAQAEARAAGAAMIAWMRWQRAPEASSSYSSPRRLRARNSVLSTAGRLMPMRSPMSL